MNRTRKASYRDVPEFHEFRRHSINECGEKYEGYIFTITHPLTEKEKTGLLTKFSNIRLFYTNHGRGGVRHNAVFVADKVLPRAERK